MMKQVSLLKRGIVYLFDLYIGSLLGTLPISIATYTQLGYITQNVYLLEKNTAYLIMIISMILMAFYYIFIPVFIWKGQTLGKKIMNIGIVYDQSSQLIKRQMIFMFFMTSFGTILGQFLSILSGYLVIEIFNDIILSMSLVFIVMIIFRKDHKGFYDCFTNTSLQNLKI